MWAAAAFTNTALAARVEYSGRACATGREYDVETLSTGYHAWGQIATRASYYEIASA